MLTYLRKNMKIIMIAVAIIFALTMLPVFSGRSPFQPSKQQTSSGFVKIDGEEVPYYRFQKALNDVASQQKGHISPQMAAYFQVVALQNAIEKTIIIKEAGKLGVSTSGGEIDQTIEQFMKSNNIATKSQLQRLLAQNGEKYEDFKKYVQDEIIYQKVMQKIYARATVEKNDFQEFRASHILIRPKEVKEKDPEKKKLLEAKADQAAKMKAEKVLKESATVNFAMLANKYSEDPGSKIKGGDLGYFTSGMMVPEFERAVFALKEGQVSKVTKSKFGYHIIKLTGKRLRKNPDPKKDIKEVILAQKQQQMFNQWLSESKEKANINIENKALQALNLMMQNKVKEAIPILYSAISADRTNPYLHLYLGDALMAEGDYKSALKNYEQAVDLNLADPDLRIILGRAYIGVKRDVIDKGKKISSVEAENKVDFVAKAKKQFKKASIVVGDNKEMHEQLAAIFRELGMRTELQNELKEIARIDKKKKFEDEIRYKATMEAKSR